MSADDWSARNSLATVASSRVGSRWKIKRCCLRALRDLGVQCGDRAISLVAAYYRKCTYVGLPPSSVIALLRHAWQNETLRWPEDTRRTMDILQRIFPVHVT